MWKGTGRSGYGEQAILGDYDDWDGLSMNGRQHKNRLTKETRDLSGADYWHMRKALEPKIPEDIPTFVNGRANIAAFAESEQKPKDKKKEPVADSIDLAEKHFQRMEKLSIDLDEEYFAGEIDEERYELLRYKMDERLVKAWKRLEKESKPLWEAEDRKLGNDFEGVSRATSHSKGMTMPSVENAYNSGKSLLKQHIATDYSIIPGNSVFSNLSEGNIFKIFAVKLLTAKRNVAKMYTVSLINGEKKMNKIKYRIILANNQGGFAIDGLASAVKGARWFGTVDRYNGIHDLAHIEVPSDEAEYFESVLDADENVIEYEIY